MDIYLLLFMMSLLSLVYLLCFLPFNLFLGRWNIVAWTLLWKEWIFSRGFTRLLWAVANWTWCRCWSFSPWCQENVCIDAIICFIMCTLDFMIFWNLHIGRYNAISIFFGYYCRFNILNIFTSLFLCCIDHSFLSISTCNLLPFFFD